MTGMHNLGTPSERIVMLDLGNVLVQFDHQIAIDALADLCGVARERIHRVVFQSGLQTAYEMGHVDDAGFVAAVQQRLGSRAASEDILRAYCDIFQPVEGMLEVVSEIESLGIPVGILSNTCSGHWDWIVSQSWPLLQRRYRPQILSFEIGSMKPHPEIYAATEAATGLRGPQIFFTDDRGENIAAAQLRGWHARPFESPQQLRAEIADWLRSVHVLPN
ncbi:MAG: HAD family phosphatase [Planctomycetota bacterium]|nr:MAG: HAD family phosphatase [Planctomycetota bacterium]